MATPGALLLDGMGGPGTQIAASATGTQSGAGGDVTVDAASRGRARNASSTACPGKGGDVDVVVGGDATLSGTASNGTASGISAAALRVRQAGLAEVMLSAGGAVAIADGAEVSSSTDGRETAAVSR